MPKNILVYSASENDDQELKEQSRLWPSRAEQEGFIHLCTLNQLNWVLQKFYSNSDPGEVWLLDAEKLSAPLKYELASSAQGEVADPFFPHLYGPINPEAIIDKVPAQWLNPEKVSARTLDILAHFRFDRLPVEGTLYSSTWRSQRELPDSPIGTAMIGCYAEHPKSVSCFHRLAHEEVWHFYSGDPFSLFLLHENGQLEEIVMGPDPLAGHQIQTVIPAHVWQAGCLQEGGDYALFGCTMAPGFTGDCFEAGLASQLSKQFPQHSTLIEKLSVNKQQTTMPNGFAQ